MITRRSAIGQVLSGLALFGTLVFLKEDDEKRYHSYFPSFTRYEEELLMSIIQSALYYVWNESDPLTGLVADRGEASGLRRHRPVASMAATGMGLSLLCGCKEISANVSGSIEERILTTLTFIASEMPAHHGFFYHLVDISSGARFLNSEVSAIDTALLVCGLILCRQSFPKSQIAEVATYLINRIDFNWMLDGSLCFRQAWSPEEGFSPWRYDSYSEALILYLLALGSTTHAIDSSSWQTLSRPVVNYFGNTYISGSPCLFTHQYVHAWFDLRHRADSFTNYFDNSRKATLAHISFCLSLKRNFPYYSEKLWGVSASDTERGYQGRGGPPSADFIGGEITPSCSIGSLMFTPAESFRTIANLRQCYPDSFRRYGFVDAINPANGWRAQDVVGIDTCMSALMAFNLLNTGNLRRFNDDEMVQRAYVRAGLLPTDAYNR